MIEADLRRRLEATLALLRRLEISGIRQASELEELAREFASFATDQRPEIFKLADLKKHLTMKITPRTLSDLAVPFERALGKSVQDDDFMVSTTDRQEPTEPRLPLSIALEDLRSSFNVGSLIRTADGLGLSGVHLLGYTPKPDEGKTAKAALGSQSAVPWGSFQNFAALKSALPAGTRFVALETSAKAFHLNSPFPKVPTVLLLGNERFGLSSDTLAACDEVRRLPLSGTKNSLNVGVMAAIAAYEWKRQWNT